MAKVIGNYDRLKIVEKRLSYLVGARLRNKDEISLAIRKQNEIREGHPAAKDWDSVSAIRRWRESR